MGSKSGGDFAEAMTSRTAAVADDDPSVRAIATPRRGTSMMSPFTRTRSSISSGSVVVSR